MRKRKKSTQQKKFILRPKEDRTKERGGTVKARISSSHTEPDKRGGFAGTVVSKIIYADEI